MKLSQIFSYLSSGELANLKIGGKDCGGIHPKYSEEVVSYIQQGLTDLHSRFVLKHGEVIVQQYEHITDYILRPEYAQYAGDPELPYHWIMDTPTSPFVQDIIRIDKVFDEVGNELPLNVESNYGSMFTTQFDVLQIPYPIADNAVAVTYVANHHPIDLKTNDPTDIEIEISAAIMRALILYVASLSHTAVGSPEALQVGFQKMQEYEALCIQIELLGVNQKDNFINTNLWRNGWV